VPIADLRPHQISAGLKEFLPDRSSTAGRVLGELRDVYSEAVANGWAESSPAMHIKRPKHRVLRQRLMFDVWQRMRVLAAASNQLWLESMLLLALVIGQRRADLRKLGDADIVTDAAGKRYLRVEQQKEAGKGFGARVEIPLALRLEAIDMTVGEVIERCRSRGKPGPTFVRQANGRQIEVSSLSARFLECYRAVVGNADPGPKRRPTLHEVRSLSARTYIEQGMLPATEQTLLGHSDLEMTELYLDERDLRSREWKRVALPAQQPPAQATP
jgi:integrase